MLRRFRLSTATGLGLTAGCAPGLAEVEIIDKDGDGYDDDFGWGDGDGEEDPPETDPGEPDQPGDPDQPDDPGEPDDPDGSSIVGAWRLLSWAPYELQYTYRGERCTYVQDLSIEWEFNDDGDGGYDGVMFLDYEVEVYGGPDCPYDGTYTGTERMGVGVSARGDARYDISVRDWGIDTTCTVEGEDMSCDVGMEWARID